MSQDFYQAEFIKPAEMPSVGLFRDGRLLVVDLANHQFPERCLKSDQPISGAHSLIKLLTYNVNADELNLIRGLVVASTNQLPTISETNKGNNVTVQLGVPLTPRQAARLKSPWPLLTAIFFILWTLACGAGLFVFVDPNNAVIFLSLILGVFIGIFGMIAGFVNMTLRTSRVLAIKRLADRKVWLTGAHPDWLARLPIYTASTELLQRDHQRAASSEWWSFATAILFGIAALVCIPIATTGYVRGIDSRAWPETSGTIQNVEVKHHTSSRRGRRREWWTVNFDFYYSVEGRQFPGKGSQTENSEWAANNNAQQKPAGTPVTVFYRPGNPADYRLERGIQDSEIFWIIGAAIVSLVAVIAVIYGLVARTRKAGLQMQLDERERLLARA
jgi:hypothetical protein